MLNLFRRPHARATIERLYGAIVAQSRRPAFYTDFAVPDTLDGRFEMVVLHTFLVCHRLKGGDETARAMSQEVFDAFVEDMDRTLREMGVGDLTVPKKMKKIGAAFYGRTAAYDTALAAPDGPLLHEALARNVYGAVASAFAEDGEAPATPGAVPAGAVAALTDYVRAAASDLAETSFDQLARGRLEFPEPRAQGA